MKKFNSMITFIYYEDFEYGVNFLTNVLELKQVMDQGFAQVYQVAEKAFLGIVTKEDRILIKEDTLISLTTSEVEEEYKRIQTVETFNCSEIKLFESIPLKSFFFEDKEGHHFEIQQFLNKTDEKNF